MAKAVYHVAKGSGSGGGLGNHIDRTPGKEYTYRHADQELTHLNQDFKVNEYCKMPLQQAISKRIEDGFVPNNADGTPRRKIRKDSVKHLDHILTGSHEQMKMIFHDERASKDWLKANYDFMCDNFGKDNIVRFTLHLDEKTPHVHCVTVPITEDGRLSAKEMVGNNKNLVHLQDLYGQAMKPFNLERGERKYGEYLTHKDTKEFYKDAREELNKRANELKKLETVEQGKLTNIKNEYHEVKSLLDDLNKNVGSLKTTEKIMTFLQPKKVVKSLEIENKELLYKLSEVTTENKNLTNKISSNNEGIAMIKQQLNNYSATIKSKDEEIKKLKAVKLDKVSNKVAQTVVEIVNRELKKGGHNEVFTIYDGKVLTKAQKANRDKKNTNTSKNKGMGM